MSDDEVAAENGDGDFTPTPKKKVRGVPRKRACVRACARLRPPLKLPVALPVCRGRG